MKIIRPNAIRDTGSSFVRASTATYCDSDGLIKTAASNIPRINYVYESGVPTHEGLLMEPAGTNLLAYSEQFDNAAWVKTIYTVNSNDTTAPDGTNTADKINEATTANAGREIAGTGVSGFAVNSVLSASIYIKDAGRGHTYIRLSSGNGTFSACYATVDLTTFSITSSGTSGTGATLVSSSVVISNNGWVRVIVTGSLASDVTSGQLTVTSYNGSSTTYVGVVGTGVYAWGAQLEVNSVATSYISTPAGSSVTRAAETISGSSGLLYSSIEEGATPLLIVRPEILVTQTVSILNAPYVFSFYGIGKVTLSGVYSYTLQGTGTSDRVYISFTPSGAGNLTITLDTAAGTVTDVQLDAGLYLKPFINEPAWVTSTNYTVIGQVVSRATATTHRRYKTVSTGVSTIAPESDPTRWTDLGPTNRWGSFDSQVSSYSQSLDSITYVIKPGRINSLALLGVSGSMLEISLVLPSTGEIVYSSSIDLNSGTAVGDWYAYFYEPIYQTEVVAITNLLDAAAMDLPGYGEAILSVKISNPNNIVKIGVLVAGISATIGSTQNAPTVGIIDYSKKEVDTFGNVDIIVRNFSKRVSAKVMFESKYTDNVNQILSQYRSYPLVWVGAQGLYTSLIVYGFYRDYDITIDNVIMSTCNLTIEGLT